MLSPPLAAKGARQIITKPHQSAAIVDLFSDTQVLKIQELHPTLIIVIIHVVLARETTRVVDQGHMILKGNFGHLIELGILERGLRILDLKIRMLVLRDQGLQLVSLVLELRNLGLKLRRLVLRNQGLWLGTLELRLSSRDLCLGLGHLRLGLESLLLVLLGSLALATAPRRPFAGSCAGRSRHVGLGKRSAIVTFSILVTVSGLALHGDLTRCGRSHVLQVVFLDDLTEANLFKMTINTGQI